MNQTILITGGAGFIGSALIRHLIASTPHAIVNVDKLTYAADLQSLAAVADDPRYCLEQLDIVDTQEMTDVFERYRPDAVMHLAAETHVDRSIDGPAVFINTNVVGTQSLLSAALEHWRGLDDDGRNRFRFHHVSTDEVFGSLGQDGAFTESSPYKPRSPYAASKAAADHLVRAWHETYGLPVVLTNCSNNYGPYQFPEKLIPLTIIRAMQGKTLPVYGTGENVRDWLHVDDHAEALAMVLASGRIGESYNIGTMSDIQNLRIVESICDILDELLPPAMDVTRRRDLITFVEDRPGHDFRYAIDASKIRSELSWQPRRSLDEGLRETVCWYLENEWWWNPHMETRYDGERLGLPKADNGR